MRRRHDLPDYPNDGAAGRSGTFQSPSAGGFIEPRHHAAERDTTGVTSRPTSGRHGLRWIEWFCVGAALFLFSGALFPLLQAGPAGILTDGDRSSLRRLSLPIYALTVVLLIRRPALMGVALRRNVPMLLLILLPLVSAFWSISQTITLRRSVALLLSMGVAYLMATRFTPRQQILLLIPVLGGATLLSLIAAVALPHLAYMPDDHALRGIFLHKNVLGWVASYTVMLGLAAQHDTMRGIRQAGWAMLGIGSVAVALSTSATGLLSAMFGWSVFLSVRAITRKQGMARITVKLALLVTAIAVFSALFIGLLPLLEFLGKDATLTGRVPLWHLVDPEIVHRPLLGYGYGVFWSEANPVAWRIWEVSGWQAPHAHNGYRDLLLGVGSVGLVLFGLVTVRALRQGTDLCSAEPRQGWLWCVATIGASLAMNLSESTFLMQNDLMWVLFATAVLTLSLRHAELKGRVPAHLRLQQAAA